MPRIYDKKNIPIDFCKKCFPNKNYFQDIFGGYGGYDSEHPDYEDDPDFYRCEVCGEKLTDEDN